MAVKDWNSFCSGILFIVVGLGAGGLSVGYQLGTPARMGSGFFPLCLGVILTGLGLALVVGACAASSERTQLERWELKPLLIILVAVAIFALLLVDFGLLASIVALVLVSSLASENIRWVPVLVTAAALAALCYLIFVVGLELQIPVLPSSLRG